MRVTIIEQPKEGKDIQREETHEIALAEKILAKKRGWELPKDSKFKLKDGKLIEKPTRKPKPKED